MKNTPIQRMLAFMKLARVLQDEAPIVQKTKNSEEDKKEAKMSWEDESEIL